MLVEWTHADLVEMAARWLRQKHSIVATDIATGGWETPDAIGWNGGHSTLVEAKASRSDFLRDAHKPFRRNPALGMGVLRYYIAPPGLLTLADLPPKWGLLEPSGKGVARRVHAKSQEANHLAEVVVLTSCLRRLGVRNFDGCVSIKPYVFETGAMATLGIRPLAATS